jgi:hypothetical protein
LEADERDSRKRERQQKAKFGGLENLEATSSWTDAEHCRSEGIPPEA